MTPQKVPWLPTCPRAHTRALPVSLSRDCPPTGKLICSSIPLDVLVRTGRAWSQGTTCERSRPLGERMARDWCNFCLRHVSWHSSPEKKVQTSGLLVSETTYALCLVEKSDPEEVTGWKSDCSGAKGERAIIFERGRSGRETLLTGSLQMSLCARTWSGTVRSCRTTVGVFPRGERIREPWGRSRG